MDETEKLGRDWVGLAEGSMGASQEYVCLFLGFCLSVLFAFVQKKKM